MTDFRRQLASAGQTIDHVNSVLGDSAVKADLRAIIAEARQATERANRLAGNIEEISVGLKTLPTDAAATLADIRAGANEARGAIAEVRGEIDDLTARINQDLDRVTLILQDVKSITGKVDAGQGTAGALVNDPRLYNALLNATEVLALTIKDIRRVAQQIEQEGVSLRLR
jgi:phospholipid/cholesterol/gamma-HCH transport system substrate-binding protein